MANYAIVCARGLGDALLSTILAHNLSLSSHKVTTFSSILHQLKDWFPTSKILPYPPPDQFHSTFSPFDTVIAADHCIIHENHNFGNRLLILHEKNFDPKKTMVHNLQSVCLNQLKLPFASQKIGITPLKALSRRAHPKRIVLHPTSSDPKKNWPPEKFKELSHLLKQKGYSPYFCVSPAERAEWEPLIAQKELPLFPTVSDLACFVYESGYLIGNDSGVGHLASALHIPTLTIFARQSYAHLWRPGWGKGLVAYPLPLIVGSRSKQKHWKQLLSAQRVLSQFEKLLPTKSY